METAEKIKRVIALGQTILDRRCGGFSSPQLRAAMRALNEVKHSGSCTAEQQEKIDRINLHILTQLGVCGELRFWERSNG